LINRKPVDSIRLYFGGEWIKVPVGDHITVDDGIYVGAEGSAVVYGGTLVAAWTGVSHVIPYGSPRDWKKLSSRPTHIDNLVAHITMDSLRAAAEREHLEWEKDCLPNLAKLLELVSLQIEPVHMCMIACRKFKSELDGEREGSPDGFSR